MGHLDLLSKLLFFQFDESTIFQSESHHLVGRNQMQKDQKVGAMKHGLHWGKAKTLSGSHWSGFAECLNQLKVRKQAVRVELVWKWKS